MLILSPTVLTKYEFCQYSINDYLGTRAGKGDKKMKKGKINNIFKGALAAGTVFGGSNVFNDMDMVYASELEQLEQTPPGEVVLPSN